MSADDPEEKKPPLPRGHFSMGTLTTTADPQLRRKVKKALQRIEREEAQAETQSG